MLPVILTDAKKALIIGGGAAALYKINSLREAGIQTVCVALEFSEPVRESGIECIEGDFYETDSCLYEMFDLIYLAIPYPEEEQKKRFFDEMVDWLKDRRIPLLVCAKPKMGSFIHPATRRKGDIILSVSTSGKSPKEAVGLAEKLIQDT